MVMGKLPVPGRPTIWMIVGQGPIALAVGAGGGCLDIFTLIYPFSPLSPSLWETARYRLKYCLKGPLNPKQPTNQLLSRIYFQCPKGVRAIEVRLYMASYRKASFLRLGMNEMAFYHIFNCKLQLYVKNLDKLEYLLSMQYGF